MVHPEISRCPICDAPTKAIDNQYSLSAICDTDHCGPNSWCKIVLDSRNIITEIRIPIHNTAVLLKHFHYTGYTFVYTNADSNAFRDRKVLLYFPKLVYNNYSQLLKTQQKLSTYLIFS